MPCTPNEYHHLCVHSAVHYGPLPVHKKNVIKTARPKTSGVQDNKEAAMNRLQKAPAQLTQGMLLFCPLMTYIHSSYVHPHTHMQTLFFHLEKSRVTMLSPIPSTMMTNVTEFLPKKMRERNFAFNIRQHTPHCLLNLFTHFITSVSFTTFNR